MMIGSGFEISLNQDNFRPASSDTIMPGLLHQPTRVKSPVGTSHIYYQQGGIL